MVIYKLFLKENQEKVYVGSTMDIHIRVKTHENLLISGKHFNKRLQDAYNKCVCKDICYEILSNVTNENRYEVENDFIHSIGIENCYNVVDSKKQFGDSLKNNPNRETIIEKISIKVRERYANLSDEQRKYFSEKSKMDKNPNWKGGIHYKKITCQCGRNKSASAKKCIKCTDKSGSNNSFYGKKHNEATRKNLSLKAKQRGLAPPNAVKVIINGTVYDSATKASKELKCSVATIFNRINNDKFTNYDFFL